MTLHAPTGTRVWLCAASNAPLDVTAHATEADAMTRARVLAGGTGEVVVWAAVVEGESVVDQNRRIYRHEAETPMRGHDPDGTCCRNAALGIEETR